jgi:Subtilase family
VAAPAAVRCYTSIGLYSSDLASCSASTSHGTAVAEAIFDVAPLATVYLGCAISSLDFQNLVKWMQSQGVQVINYSAARPWDGPGDGTSPNSDSPLNTVAWAANNGITFVTAAGNQGRSTWFGAWVDQNQNNRADFGGSDDNLVWLASGETVSIQLRWQDSWTYASRDLDLGLLNQADNLVASSLGLQSGTYGSTPFESLQYTALYGGWYLSHPLIAG